MGKLKKRLGRFWRVTDLPRERIMGHRQSLVRLMAKLWMVTGLKLSSRGYSSMGLRVPEVMITYK
jgi:hypothetical protein